MPLRHRRYGGTPATALAQYVLDHASEWIDAWCDQICADELTVHYHDYADHSELKRDTEALYNYLALWLQSGKWDERIDPHYQRIGRDRRAAGFPINEVIMAVLLAKKNLWDGISSAGQLSLALELEAWKAIGAFYDSAILNIAIGYESADTA